MCVVRVAGKLEKTIRNIANVETAAGDANYLPFRCQVTSFCVYLSSMCACFAALVWYGYTQNINSTFISLDPKAGFCKTNSTLSTCCPVPKEVSGTFLIDTNSYWDDEVGFTYRDQIYSLDVLGFQGDDSEYSLGMRIIRNDFINVAVTRGSNRDYGWNMVAWASYSFYVINVGDAGLIRFTLAGNIGVMFNKPIVKSGYASNYSAATVYSNLTDTAAGKNKTYSCAASVTSTFNPSSRLLTVDNVLNTGSNCKATSTGYSCTNPCPKIMSPQAMGYNSLTAKSTTFSWTMDMASVMTAIAVNYGILRLEFLQEYPEDPSRVALLTQMYNAGSISSATFSSTSSYFDISYAPMSPIYW